MRRELLGSAFQFLEQAFDSIPISMSDMLKSEPELVEGSLEPWCAIDEKHGVGDVVFLTKLCQELLCQDDRSGWNNLTYKNSFASGSTAADSQKRWSLSCLTVSSIAT